MSISNILTNNPTKNNNTNTIIYCSGLRCQNTCQCKNLLASDESTFLSKLNVYGDGRFYSDVQIDGTLTCAGYTGGTGTYNTINAVNANIDNISCLSITGNTATFAGITATAINTTSIVGTNCNMSGVVFGGSCIFSNGTFSAGLTCGQKITCLNLQVNNGATVTNNLNVGQSITCQNLQATNNLQSDTTATFNQSTTQYGYTDKKCVVPRLNTGDRDAIGGEDGCILDNTDLNYIQTFKTGLWETVAYYPQIMQMYLNSDETLANATLHKIGSTANMSIINNSNPSYQFEYADFGELKINVAGFYKCSCTIAIQPNSTAYSTLQMYIYFGVASGSNMIDWLGVTDNVGPYYLPNKEKKIQFECTSYLDPDKYAFFFYQENNTGGDFQMITSPYAPFAGSYNCKFTIQYIGPNL